MPETGPKVTDNDTPVIELGGPETLNALGEAHKALSREGKLTEAHIILGLIMAMGGFVVAAIKS